MTLIIPKKYLNFEPVKLIIKDNKVGVRIPNHFWLKKLLKNVGPIVASSANKKGERTPSKFEEIDHDIIKNADLAIKTNKIPSGKPSRIYDLELKKRLR